MERNGLRVNVHKTKGLQLLFGMESSVSKVDPCGVCDEQVVCNSIQCTKCQRQVYHRCSVVPSSVFGSYYNFELSENDDCSCDSNYTRNYMLPIFMWCQKIVP